VSHESDIAAWGAHHGPLSWRRGAVLDLLTRSGRTVEVLARTKHGHPRHPLYVRADVEPVAYQRARAAA
jgi:hypothetical protein